MKLEEIRTPFHHWIYLQSAGNMGGDVRVRTETSALDLGDVMKMTRSL